MNILCKMFGHQPPIYATPGWYSPGEQYGTIRIGATDGIGRIHGEIYADCPRCGKEYMMARVHVPTIEVEKKDAII